MKNKLVSVEKWKAQQKLLSDIRNAFDNMQKAIGEGDAIESKEYRNDMYSLVDSIRELQDMPDFVESNEDIREVANAIQHEMRLLAADEISNKEYPPMHPNASLAKAAINALK